MATTTIIEKVFARINYERRSPSQLAKAFKLDSIELLLQRLGNPHQQLDIIHIAGTKGKGSTAQFAAAIGRQLGFKTGVYSSPHFEHYTERFQIDQANVSKARLEAVLTKVVAQVEVLDQEIKNGLALRPATFFDISTATAFLLFKEEQVDLVALEVGLGGRLDSTNVCIPLVSVVTSISFDHTKQLGNTLPEIATEKAAIIKPDGVAVSGCIQPEIIELVRSKANSENAKFFQLGESFFANKVTASVNKLQFDYAESTRDNCGSELKNSNIDIQKISLSVCGNHQANNAAIAIKSVAEFCKRKSPVARVSNSDFANAIKTAIPSVSLKGRLEIVSRDPLVILDMAHNEVSIAAMVDAINTNWPDENLDNGKRQAIFACAKDKDHHAIVQHLKGAFDRIVFTEFKSNVRAQSASVLVDSFHKTKAPNRESKCVVIDTPELAWAEVKAGFKAGVNVESPDANEFALTCICGSIFLVGEMFEMVRTDLKRIDEKR